MCWSGPKYNSSSPKMSSEKRSSLFNRLFGSSRTAGKEDFDCESDESEYESGDDDEEFGHLPSDDANDIFAVSFGTNKDSFGGQFSKKTFQAPVPSDDLEFGGAELIDFLVPERSPPSSTRARSLKRSSGRTQSTLSFDEELGLLDDSPEVFPIQSQKRMLISFKEERERVIVWNTVSVESLPNTYVFNIGDVVYLEGAPTVQATIVQTLDDGKRYRVQLRHCKTLRDVSQAELQHCIKIIVHHPSIEQIEFFETCENESNKNLLSTASSSFALTPQA